MKRALTTALSLGTASIVLATTFSASAIIRGRPADERVGKAAIYIYDSKNEAICSGVVVHPRMILTAGHCLVKTKKEALSFSIQKAPKDVSTRLPVASIHTNDKYLGDAHGMQSEAQTAGDLGVILMSESILSRLKLAETDLPSVITNSSEIAASLRIIGYGYGSRDARIEDSVRRELSVRADVVGSALRLTSLEKDKSACFGDSGSGVFSDDGVKTMVLGIVASIKPGGKLAEEFKKKSAQLRAENEVKRQKIVARNLKKGITTPVPEIPINMPDGLMSRVCGDRDTVTQAVPVARHLCWIRKATSISLASGLDCSGQE